jgi:hypothetical protein
LLKRGHFYLGLTPLLEWNLCKAGIKNPCEGFVGSGMNEMIEFFLPGATPGLSLFQREWRAEANFANVF